MNNLPEAIAWTQARWHLQREAPTRLHTRDMEPTHAAPVKKGCRCLNCTTVGHKDDAALGSHAYHPGFAAALEGNVNTIRSESRTVACYHPLGPDCRECLGTGVKEQRSDLYAFPMSLALRRLSAVPAQRKHPHPYALVVILASHGWDARQAARSLNLPWDRAEALFLIALRKLAARYEEGPVDTRTSTGGSITWIEKSESQQSAETAA